MKKLVVLLLSSFLSVSAFAQDSKKESAAAEASTNEGPAKLNLKKR